MALTTLGSGDVASRVEATIQRRGADGTPLAMAWTSLAVGGVLLAVISLFSVWYAAARTATALNSGWMPGIALVLVIVAGLLLAAKQFGVIAKGWRMNADVFIYGTVLIAFALLVLNQIAKSDMTNAVYLLLLPIAVLAVAR